MIEKLSRKDSIVNKLNSITKSYFMILKRLFLEVLEN